MLLYSAVAVLVGCLSTIAQSATCGVKGYNKATAPAFILNNTTSSVFTLSGCKAYCAASTVQKCASFAIEAAPAPACLLYNVTVAESINAVNTSSYTFYDASCPTS